MAPLQEVGGTVAHKSETVYRHMIMPAIRGGATVMDAMFGTADRRTTVRASLGHGAVEAS